MAPAAARLISFPRCVATLAAAPQPATRTRLFHCPLSTRPRGRRVLRPSAAYHPPLHSAGGGRRAAGAFGAGRAPPRPLLLGAPPPLLTGVLRRHRLHLRGHRRWQHRDGGLALRRQLGGRRQLPDLPVRAAACPPLHLLPPPSPRPQRLRRPLGPSSPQELGRQGSLGHGADGAGAFAAADLPVRPAPLPPGRL